MVALVKMAAGFVVWSAALYGVLQIRLLTGSDLHSHSICGPWGCGPPLTALFAMHGFWILLATPPVGLMVLSWTAQRLHLAGWVLTGVGVLGMVGVGIWEATHWLPIVSAEARSYFLQRYLFSLATLVDLPVIPITLSGCIALAAARMKRTSTPRQSEPETSRL